MRFERKKDIKIWHEKDDGVHNGEYIGNIIIDDENQAWFVTTNIPPCLDASNLRQIADKMDALEKE